MDRLKVLNTVFHFGRCVAACGALTFAYQRLQPAPIAYGRSEFNSNNGKEHVQDPKAEIKFGNVGFGPMYLHSLVVKDKNGVVLSPEKAFSESPTNKYVLDSSRALFGNFTNPRAWQTNSLIPIVTVRPSNANHEAGGAFAADFFDKLRNDGIHFEVTTACSDMAPLNYFKTTRKLYVPPSDPVYEKEK